MFLSISYAFYLRFLIFFTDVFEAFSHIFVTFFQRSFYQFFFKCYKNWRKHPHSMKVANWSIILLVKTVVWNFIIFFDNLVERNPNLWYRNFLKIGQIWPEDNRRVKHVWPHGLWGHLYQKPTLCYDQKLKGAVKSRFFLVMGGPILLSELVPSRWYTQVVSNLLEF